MNYDYETLFLTSDFSLALGHNRSNEKWNQAHDVEIWTGEAAHVM